MVMIGTPVPRYVLTLSMVRSKIWRDPASVGNNPISSLQSGSRRWSVRAVPKTRTMSGSAVMDMNISVIRWFVATCAVVSLPLPVRLSHTIRFGPTTRKVHSFQRDVDASFGRSGGDEEHRLSPDEVGNVVAQCGDPDGPKESSPAIADEAAVFGGRFGRIIEC